MTEESEESSPERDEERDGQICTAYSEIFSAPTEDLIVGGGGTALRKIEELFPDPFRAPSGEDEHQPTKVS